MVTLSRRSFLQLAACFLGSREAVSKEWQDKGIIRRITHGPAFHWFGYYDKFQFDPADRYVLGMEVTFEHRSPRPEDRIVLGLIDLAADDRWTPFAETSAWCWQQGCMLQWRPGSDREVVFNDREGDHYVCRIQDVKSGRVKTIGFPIYALTPDGQTAVSTDFRRLSWLRPGYGYNGIPDPYAEQPAPEESGIWRVDLNSGRVELIISIAQVAAIPWRYGRLDKSFHWFNHLLVNPAGSRFVFLHRWKEPAAKSWQTRMLSANLDGSDMRVVIDSGFVSHFVWQDAHHVLAYSKQRPDGGWGFFLWEDRPGGMASQLGAGIMGPGDGHCNYLPGNEWIVCDTYPDSERKQHVYLYHVPSNRRVELAALPAPHEYTGEWRCDTHPRVSRSGRYITVDSPHENGRQIYLIDLAFVLGQSRS